MASLVIPLHAVPVLHALARCQGAVSFAELKESTSLTQATLNRILKCLCEFGYAIKVGHGRYAPGAELVGMGVDLTRNQIVPAFMPTLTSLRRQTHLNAELYIITPGGPIYLAHSPARGEAGIPFRYGHVIQNRTAHPAGLFFMAIHKSQKPAGYKKNFIVDRGGQWPELFRAAAMIPGSIYCLVLSGMLINVGPERHDELKEALHRAGAEMELP